MSKLIIAIDPDVDKSGLAVLNTESKRYVLVKSVGISELLTIIPTYAHDDQCAIFVEAGYLNASNWHTLNAKNKAMAAAIGNSTGRNHETARKIVELLKDYLRLPNVHEVKPLRKCWRGKDGKITHDELVAMTGFDKTRSNQDERDAALLAWYYSNLPMIIKPNTKK